MEKQQIPTGEHIVVCQKWEERELGWGSRPDGLSLHVSHEALKRYIAQYWEGMPDEVPHEYSKPCGTPYEVGVSQEVAEQLADAEEGVRYIESLYEYPG